MKIQIESSKTYEQLWRSKKRYIISIGGRGGGRSYEASQKIAGRTLQTTELSRIAIMRAVHSDIRHSIWQEILDRVNDWQVAAQMKIADSTMEIEYGRNSIHAHGFRKSSSERTAKLKSLAGYTDAFIEEAEEIGEEEFQQLDDSLRTKGSQIHLILNTPSKSHWIVKRWFEVIPSEQSGFYRLRLKDDSAEFIFADHTVNHYMPDEVHDRYEQYKVTQPQYYWQMIRGYSPEVVMGRIYSGWREVQEIPHEARLLGYGLDFGFAKDPDAIIAVYYHNGGYILDEKHYSTGNDHESLIRVVKMLGNAPIVADAADPRMISTLRGEGVNIIESDKGAGSVEHGIRHVQGLKVSYTSTSTNLFKEYENYAWLILKTGEEKNMPDPKCADHLLDGLRYFASKMIDTNSDPEADFREQVEIEVNQKDFINQQSTKFGL